MDKYLNDDDNEDFDIDELSGINIDNVLDDDEYEESSEPEEEQEVEIKRAGVVLSLLAILAIGIIVVMVVLGMNNNSSSAGDVILATTENETDEEKTEIETEYETSISITTASNETRKYKKISGFLNENEYPLVLSTIYQYFDYLKDGDVESLLDILIINQENSEFEERINSTKDIVESYDNITCYLLKGLENDCYVVYVAYDIKFYNIDTPAPSLSRFYVQKNDKGQMIINQGDISNMLNMYLYAAAQYNHVKELIHMVDDEYEAAKKLDPKLSFVMGYMR